MDSDFAVGFRHGWERGKQITQEKIDDALNEVYKMRNEILQANGCYEPNDVLDIIDEISSLFEKI